MLRVEFIDDEDYYVDINYNIWRTSLHSREEAEKLSQSLKNCYCCNECFLCANCFSCFKCDTCINCSYCAICKMCINCMYCGEASYCKNCENSTYVDFCINCENTWHSSYCMNVKGFRGCNNLDSFTKNFIKKEFYKNNKGYKYEKKRARNKA